MNLLPLYKPDDFLSEATLIRKAAYRGFFRIQDFLVMNIKFSFVVRIIFFCLKSFGISVLISIPYN